MTAATPPADAGMLFFHIRMVFSMIVSLGIARLLSGIARFVQHPGRHELYWVHLVWTASMFLLLVDFWWWEFGLARHGAWRFEAYVFVVAYAAINFLLCAMLFPDDLSDYQGYRDYFLSRRVWFFSLLALSSLMDVADSAIKGRDHLAALGPEYTLQAMVLIPAYLLAARLRNERFHAAFAVIHLLYQISWIERHHPLPQ